MPIPPYNFVSSYPNISQPSLTSNSNSNSTSSTSSNLLNSSNPLKRNNEQINSNNVANEDKKKCIQVRCRHLLLKHKESRRPSSHRQQVITRTKEEALQIVKDLRQQIIEGKSSFEALAEQYSDCSSFKKGGDLGFFKRGAMQKAFEDASYFFKFFPPHFISFLKIFINFLVQFCVGDKSN